MPGIHPMALGLRSEMLILPAGGDDRPRPVDGVGIRFFEDAHDRLQRFDMIDRFLERVGEHLQASGEIFLQQGLLCGVAVVRRRDSWTRALMAN